MDYIKANRCIFALRLYVTKHIIMMLDLPLIVKGITQAKYLDLGWDTMPRMNIYNPIAKKTMTFRNINVMKLHWLTFGMGRPGPSLGFLSRYMKKLNKEGYACTILGKGSSPASMVYRCDVCQIVSQMIYSKFFKKPSCPNHCFRSLNSEPGRKEWLRGVSNAMVKKTRESYTKGKVEVEREKYKIKLRKYIRKFYGSYNIDLDFLFLGNAKRVQFIRKHPDTPSKYVAKGGGHNPLDMSLVSELERDYPLVDHTADYQDRVEAFIESNRDNYGGKMKVVNKKRRQEDDGDISLDDIDKIDRDEDDEDLDESMDELFDDQDDQDDQDSEADEEDDDDDDDDDDEIVIQEPVHRKPSKPKTPPKATKSLVDEEEEAYYASLGIPKPSPRNEHLEEPDVPRKPKTLPKKAMTGMKTSPLNVKPGKPRPFVEEQEDIDLDSLISATAGNPGQTEDAGMRVPEDLAQGRRLKEPPMFSSSGGTATNILDDDGQEFELSSF